MAKSIRLTLEAYEILKSRRKPGATFSEVITRVTAEYNKNSALRLKSMN
jgi:predicted CopG family antitoxin